MSFSTAQKTDIYYYLGYPLAVVNATLDAAIDAAEGSDTRAEEIVITLLEGLADAAVKVDTLLESAGIKKIDELEFFGPSISSGGLSTSTIDARSYGKMLVKRLASVLGVDILEDVFQGIDRTVAASNKPTQIII